MRPFSIPSFIFFAAVFCLITVSFNKSWYHTNKQIDTDEFYPYINYYPTKIEIGPNFRLSAGEYTFQNEKVSYNKFYKDALGFDVFLAKRLIDASFSFAILAWVVSFGMIVISVLDILGKNTPFKIGKFLGFVVFIFTLLSFLIYLGVPARLLKDCEDSKSYSDCSFFGFHKKFFGTFNEGDGEGDFKAGSSIGWNCVTISCAVALCGSVYNIFFFSHERGNLR